MKMNLADTQPKGLLSAILWSTAIAAHVAATNTAAAATATLRADVRPVAQVASGVELLGNADGASVSAWDTTGISDGWETLSSGSATTNVLVLNDGPVVEGGRLAGSAEWSAERVHVVRHNVVVPSGVALSVDAGAAVKFVDGARIVVENGGELVVDGALFADFADDSVGGDTNLDGGLSAPTTRWPDWTDVPDGTLVRVRFVDGNAESFPARVYATGRPLGSLPAPERTGARFEGWRTGRNGEGESVDGSTPATSAVETLYADWTTFSINLVPSATNLTATARGVTFSVLGNTSWTATTSDDWIKLRTRGGNGDGTAGFTVSANEAAASRTGTVRIALAEGGLSRDFTVVQAGMEAVAAPVITPGDGTTFRASAQRVAIRCATAGAVVRYTLDGSEPAATSTLCPSGGFNVFDTTTVKARAFADGMLPSAVATVRLVRLQTLAEALDVPLWTVSTDETAPWMVDTENSADGSGSSTRSGLVGNDESTAMWTTVDGSGTLTFRWRVSCEDSPDEDYPWDFLSFDADGSRLAWIDGRTAWREVRVELGTGTHRLQWTFSKDFMDGDDVGENCGWVDHVTWTPTVIAGDAAIPAAWFENHGLVAVGGTAETAAVADPDGDGHTTAEEYVAGTDPNDPESILRACIEIVDGRPVVTWTPDLLDDRTYRVLGKKTLDPAEEWTDVTDETDLDTAGFRFFKVKVEMK